MADLLSAFDTAWAFIGLILGFGFIVFVHELGHFLVAKAVGVKCLQFAVGMGHAILAYRKGLGLRFGSTQSEYESLISQGEDPAAYGETEYRICWLPIGGYVKLLGQDDMDPSASSNDPRALTSKPIWARACVFSAGVVMNVIFAVVFFVIAFMAGVQFPPGVVGDVVSDMPAATTFAEGYEGDVGYLGLQSGDRITHINGDPASGFMEVAIAAALSARGTSLRLTVERQDHDKPLYYTMTPKVDPNSKLRLLALGIEPPKRIAVQRTVEGDMLNEAGVKPDMIIKQVAGQNVSEYGQVNRLIGEAHGLPVQVSFVDEKTGESAQLDVHALPQLTRESNQPSNLAGLVPAVRVDAVLAESPALKAGLREGDLIIEFDGQPWPYGDELRQIVKNSKGRMMQVTVMRDGELVTIANIAADRTDKIGIAMSHYHLKEAIVATALPGSPAAVLEMTRGSVIRTMNGQPVNDWSDVQRLMQDHIAAGAGEARITVGFELNVKDRPESNGMLVIDEATDRSVSAARWIDPLGGWMDDLREPVVAGDPIEATMLGIEKTHQIMLQTYLTLARLVQGTIKVRHLRGPVGIVHEGTRIAAQGWTYLMFFLGLISVNLAVINFLPIPIVDGGHIVFLIIEKLKGSPVSPRVHVAAWVVGLALIGSILLLTLFYDTARLLGVG